MSTASHRASGPATPTQVTIVRILVSIQAVVTGVDAIASVARGVQDHKLAAGLVGAAVDVVIAATLLAAVAKLGSCEPWTRVAVVAFEGLVILLDVAVMVVTGRTFGVLGIAIAAVAVVLLMTSPARACFARAERR